MDHQPEPTHPARIPTTPARPTIPARRDIHVHHRAEVAGRVHLAVLDPKGAVVRDHGWQSNLILNGGIDKLCLKNGAFWEEIAAAQAGTGTTPTKVVLDGTFAQSGTTVTRSSGTGTFSSGDVGKKIKFAGGEVSRITAYTNSTTVTVTPSRTVSASAATVYNVNQTGLATFVKGTTSTSSESGAQTTVFNSSTGEMLMRRTFIFSAESGSVNYTEVAVGSSATHNTGVIARVVLDSPVTVGTGQQLRLTYEVTLSDSQAPGASPRTLSISGWPYTYQIQSITSTGSYFDVVLDKAHHYTTGAAFNISGALPVKAAITGITSTGSDFTVTTGTAHNFTTGQSIEIEDCTVNDYNGTWTVASTPTSTTYTVTSAANPGPASDGTTRRTTPGTWYDGAWTVASAPTSTTVRVTSAINPIAAGADGTAQGNTEADVYHPTYGWIGVNENVTGSLYHGSRLYEGNQVRAFLIRAANMLTPSSFPWSTIGDPSNGIGASSATNSNISYVSGTGTRTNVVVWNLDVGNQQDIRQIAFYFNNGSNGQRELNLLIQFDERQRKDSGYELRLTITRQIDQVLN